MKLRVDCCWSAMEEDQRMQLGITGGNPESTRVFVPLNAKLECFGKSGAGPADPAGRQRQVYGPEACRERMTVQVSSR